MSLITVSDDAGSQRGVGDLEGRLGTNGLDTGRGGYISGDSGWMVLVVVINWGDGPGSSGELG